MFTYDEEGERHLLGFYLGVVQFNDDPEKLGRVRVHVPGLIEPASPWAFPVGGAHSTGAKNLGAYDVPPVGATVLLGFHGGDPDRPFFLGAFHGQGEQLTVTPGAPADADKLKVYESARFLIVLNGIGGSEELLVKDKSTGDLISMKQSQLKINASTKVTVIAPQVEIGGEGLAAAPLINGVVLASGIDPFTGKTYGVLQSASAVVTAKKA